VRGEFPEDLVAMEDQGPRGSGLGELGIAIEGQIRRVRKFTIGKQVTV
jgi:hypothetical protein